MAQIAIDPFVNVVTMTELLQKVLPDKKDVYRCMINNVRICIRKKNLELDSANIQIDPKHLNQCLLIHIWTQLTIILKVNNYCIYIYYLIALFVCKLYIC